MVSVPDIYNSFRSTSVGSSTGPAVALCECCAPGDIMHYWCPRGGGGKGGGGGV